MSELETKSTPMPTIQKFPKSVIKRDGREVAVEFDKITRRVQGLSAGLDIEPTMITQKVTSSMVDKMHVSQLDELAAHTAAGMAITYGPDYAILAGRLMVSNLHKETPSLFSEAIFMVHYQKYPLSDDDRKGKITEGFYDPKFVRLVKKHAHVLDAAIQHDNDYKYNYFGIDTLMTGYLNKVVTKTTTRIIERPQYMLMRIALFLNQDSIPDALQTYRIFSNKGYTHATPTLSNSGKKRAQLASCFLLQIPRDSMDSIYDTQKQCAMISKNGGGIGLSIHKIRAKGSIIRSSNGKSHGIVPMLKCFETTAQYCDQGATRKGAFAIYLEPWHNDIEMFLKLRYNRGKEHMRTRDLFTALWVPDLFMKRVESNAHWTLFCPDSAPGLSDVWGDEFEALYKQYELEGRGKRQLPATKLWRDILNAQIETGTPYLLYKDACNRKSNQKNLGTIQSSNLCVEILEYTSEDEIAVCLTGDSEVVTRDGLKRLDQCDGAEVLVPFESDVNFKDNLRFIKATLIDNGVRDVFEIITSSEHIRATSKHLFLCRKAKRDYHNGGIFEWKTLDTINVGDTLYRVSGFGITVSTATVVQIRYKGSERVYDLNVPGAHHFIANNLVVHNCNLASIALPSCVVSGAFSHQQLYDTVYVAIKNLNKIIDLNYYPVPEAKKSNMRHRPVGLGVTGLADTFALLRIPYESEEARKLNREIFETMYFAALTSSKDLAKASKPYETFEGSPLSKGIFQFEMWEQPPVLSGRHDWELLRAEIKTSGVRNSLLVSLMPTASTSQIMGYAESFEPFTRNVYMRNTQSGEYVIFNEYLVKDLRSRGLWSPSIIQKIVANQGSIQRIEELAAHGDLRDLYKTVYEMKLRTLIDMSADRGAFICQSQSFNVFIENPTVAKLHSSHFYGWKRGLKTGMYYLRSNSAVEPIQFSLDADLAVSVRKKQLGFVGTDHLQESSLVKHRAEGEPVEEEEEEAERPQCDETCLSCSV